MDKDMYAEIICDSAGIHLSSEMIEFVLAVKGSDRVVLISDSFVGEPSPKGMEHITDLSFDANGNLSGSKLTLDVACRNLVKHTGCSMKLRSEWLQEIPPESSDLTERSEASRRAKRQTSFLLTVNLM